MSEYLSDWDNTVPECWAERPLQCGEASCETGEWCTDGECKPVRTYQCNANCSNEGESKLPGRYCTCAPLADIEALFCGPATEGEGEGSGEGEGDMDGGDMSGEGDMDGGDMSGEGEMDGGDMSGEGDSGEDDGEPEEEAEPSEPIETTGAPLVGIDLNQNGIDDFEEYVPPPEDCSCLITNDFATIFFD